MRILLAAILLFMLAAGAAQAATALFYSDEEQYYGWAAGYSSASRAESEAMASCKQGGKTCKFAIDCFDGYGAVAFAVEPAHGVGMACGMTSALAARSTALVVCMKASQALCWTDTTFDANGNDFPADDNDLFDRVWYGQNMLYAIGFDAGDMDGENGPSTRRQLIAFQQKFGLPADGEFSLDVIWRLLNAVGGPQAMGEGLYKAVIEPHEADYAGYTYALASAPAAKRDYSEEIATYAKDEQLRGLATVLTARDRPCTIPAKSAEPLPADGSGAWNVACVEGDFTIFFGDGPTMITTGLSDITVNADGSVSATPRNGDGTSTISGDGGSVTIGGDDAGTGTTETPRPPAGGTGRTLGH